MADNSDLGKLNRYMGGTDDAAQFVTPIGESEEKKPSQPHYGSEFDKDLEELLTDIEDNFIHAWDYMQEYMPHAVNRVSGSPDFKWRIQNGRDRFKSGKTPIQDRYLVLRTLLSEMGWALHQFGIQQTDQASEE